MLLIDMCRELSKETLLHFFPAFRIVRTRILGRQENERQSMAASAHEGLKKTPLYLVHEQGGGGAPEQMLLEDRPLLASIALWGVVVVAVLYAPGG
jgi:hypothetical protein